MYPKWCILFCGYKCTSVIVFQRYTPLISVLSGDDVHFSHKVLIHPQKCQLITLNNNTIKFLFKFVFHFGIDIEEWQAD